MLTRNEAVSRAINIAEDDSHGYSQLHRDGNPDFDCSSLGLWVYGLGTNGYSGNICSIFANNGATIYDFDGNLNDLESGDLLVKEGSHVAIYIGGGRIVEASIDENGGIRGDNPGDQTGDEIHIRGVYNYPWNKVISPNDGSADGGSDDDDSGDSGASDRDVTLYVRALVNGQWGEPVETCAGEGSAVGNGVDPITGIAMSVNCGDGQYRVHLAGGDWLPWVYCRDADTGNGETGFAGDDAPIDAVQFEYLTPNDVRPYKYAFYHVGTAAGWYDWVRDLESPEGDGYAGEFGEPIVNFSVYVG